MTCRPLPASLLVMASLAAPAQPQLAFNEVLVDPAGIDAGRQVVELVNTSSSAFTPTGWQLCAPFAYAPLPSLSVPPGGIVRVFIGRSGTDTPTQWFMPLMRTLLKADTLLLYKSANFNNSADIADFVGWGGGVGRIAQAVSVGQWPSSSATVPLPPVDHTLAWIGAGDAPAAWFRDGTPTLGAGNGSGTVSVLGTGCPTSVGPSVLVAPSPAVDGNIDFILAVTGAPPSAGVVFLIGQMPAGGVPVLGCPIEALPVLSVVRSASAAGIATLPLSHYLPGVSLTGATLYYQALIADPAAANGLFGASWGLRVVVG